MNNPDDPRRDPEAFEPGNELMLRPEEDTAQHEAEHERMSSVRDTLTRIPESLSAIGRDISRTIERAIAVKEDYVIGVKVSPQAGEKLEQLVQAGVFRSRAEAAAYLIDEGIRAQAPLFERVEQKLAEIERLRAELRGIVDQQPQQ